MTKRWEEVHYLPDKNPVLDAYARVKTMKDVWVRLEELFPLIRSSSEKVWLARRNGRIRALIERDDRFTTIRNPLGPQNKEQWILLAQACIEAVYGRTASESDLDMSIQTWLSQTHETD